LIGAYVPPLAEVRLALSLVVIVVRPKGPFGRHLARRTCLAHGNLTNAGHCLSDLSILGRIIGVCTAVTSTSVPGARIP
jgi:hypothetical protein